MSTYKLSNLLFLFSYCNLLLLTKNQSNSIGYVKEIYFDSFPKNERMPFPMMVAMSKLWNTEFLGFL